MKRHSIKSALLAATVLMGAAAPVTAALADTTAHTGSVYDSFDKFKDASGRPISGWQYLIYAANGNG